jgi:septation ring formation regulator EzrA
MATIEEQEEMIQFELAKLKSEQDKALFWADKLKNLKTEVSLRRDLLNSNIKHLKKDGVISSFTEFSIIKNGLLKSEAQLDSLDLDLKTVTEALKKIDKDIKILQSKHQAILSEKNNTGKLLVFGEKK